MIVTTIYGDMDDSLLIKKVGSDEDHEKTLSWVEYWLKDELVHRSLNLHLKQGIDFGISESSLV